MPTTFGPSFVSELTAAGLLGLPFVWYPDGTVSYGDDLTGEQKAALDAVVAAHDPETPAPSSVPLVVSRFQGREAMWQTPHGETTLFEAAEAIINHQDTPGMYKRAWADLQEFRRDSEMLQAIAAVLGLTAANLDSLFILAESIKA